MRLAFSQRVKQGHRRKDSGFSSWPTAKTVTGGANSKRTERGAGGPDLQEVAQNWTTPQAHDVSPRGSGQKPSSKAGNACLARDAQNWPTPSARDWKGEPSQTYADRGGGKKGEALPAYIAHYFTHPDLRNPMFGAMSLVSIRKARRLYRLATSRLSPVTLRRLLKRESFQKRRLNVGFVEWLMGWPPGHAACDCSATEFILWQQHMRGALCQLPTASAAWIWKPLVETEVWKQADLL
nr:hypothetical protein [uncultured Roseibium sp.]